MGAKTKAKGALLLVLLSVPNPAPEASEKAWRPSPQELSSLSQAMRTELAGLQYLLNPYQIKQFLSLPDDSARGEWLRTFWKSRDPTPTTEENEMKREHNIRVRLARQLFPARAWPGWDKRGEVFIRYGLPDYRGKVWGEVTHKRMYPPGEIWYYKRHNMLVSFQNFGLHGEYVYSLNPEGAAQNLSPELMEFIVYDTENTLSERIPANLLQPYPTQDFTTHLRGTPLTLPENIDAVMDPDRPRGGCEDLEQILNKEKVEEMAANFETALEEMPASYPFNFTHSPLPFYFDISQFRGGEGFNRIELHLEVPVTIEGEGGERRFQAAAVVWDPSYREIDRKSIDMLLSSPGTENRSEQLVPTQLIFSLRRGYYRMAVTVREEEGKRFSSYRVNLSSEDFDGPLAISDIVFARKLAPAIGRTGMFMRGPWVIVPHPLRAYRKGFKIPVFFEIYNLRPDEKGMTSYLLEYKVIPHEKAKRPFWETYRQVTPAVSSRFTASGYGSTQIHRLYLGSENLWQGSFDLMITVTDTNAYATAFRRASFSVLE